MNGKTSPAWKNWFDQMCKKCLVNAADSEIPKIGVNSDTTKLLNDMNTNDIDYVDVTDEKEMEKIPEKIKKTLSEDEFNELVNNLYDYEISLKSAQQKYKGYEFSDEQKQQIKKAGTIDDNRLTEIIDLVVAGKKELNHFKEFYLTPKQFEIVEFVFTGNAMKDEK